MTNFNEIINRQNTGSIKVDFNKEYGKPDGLIPLWVADMDFRSPPEVQAAIRYVANHGVFGYTHSKPGYFEAIAYWFKKNFEWRIDPEWIVQTPGVMFTIGLAIRALVPEQRSVMIQEPVYYPFRQIVRENKRQLIVNQLVLENGSYTVDYEAFEKDIVENRVKMFLLCSPHNPIGRVWRKEELLKMGRICIKHNVLIVSDEIHADIIYPGRHHRIFATLGTEFAADTLICTSPSKTFNMPGLQVSNTFISNRFLRERINAEKRKLFYFELSSVALAATEAAYRFGQFWHDELVGYLTGNLDVVEKGLAGTKIKLIHPEGTYLLWLDCRELGLTDDQLDLFFTKAGLWLHRGILFGNGGSGFMRMNIASPRPVIQNAVERIKTYLARLKPRPL